MTTIRPDGQTPQWDPVSGKTNKKAAAKPDTKSGSNKRLAIKVGVTSLATLTSPLLMLGAGVIATSKLLSSNNSLWDKTLSKAILPAADRTDIPHKPAETEHLHHFKVTSAPGVELDGIVMSPKGVDAQTAAKLPVAVLFCQNSGAMEGPTQQRQANEYIDAGFNVVLFNYRGVGESTGTPKRGSDLVDDGSAVVNRLLDEGLNIGHGVLLKPSKEHVLLDGSSIGGAVAIAIGKEHPEMVLAANRTFTRWIDAAEGVVRKYSNPVFSKVVKKTIKESPKAKLDNLENLNQRLASEHHSFTVIETAGQTGDGVLTRDAKLQRAHVTGPEVDENLQEQWFADKDHGSYISLADRTVLYERVIKNQAHRYQLLKGASAVETNKSSLTGAILEKSLNSFHFGKLINQLNKEVNTLSTPSIEEEDPEVIAMVKEKLDLVSQADLNALLEKAKELRSTETHQQHVDLLGKVETLVNNLTTLKEKLA